jgi:hypothetical protein
MNGYVQDERYIAIEHMDVRRDCSVVARQLIKPAVRLLSCRTAINKTCGTIAQLSHVS